MVPPLMEIMSPARSVLRYSRFFRSMNITESPSWRGAPVVRSPLNMFGNLDMTYSLVLVKGRIARRI